MFLRSLKSFILTTVFFSAVISSIPFQAFAFFLAPPSTLVLLPPTEDPRGFSQSFSRLFSFRPTFGLRDARDPSQFILTMLRFVLSLVALLAVIALIWGGIQYIMAGGDEKASAKAKSTILGAIIGLIVIGFSVVIVNIIILILF